jgi:hypothetical protein
MQLIHDYDHLEPRQFAELILENLKTSFGVDLRPILETPQATRSELSRRATVALVEAIFTRAHQDGTWADWSDSEANLSNTQLHAALDESVEDEPNYSIIPSDLPTILAYRGDAVKTYIYTLTKRFENMSNAKTPGQLAIELSAGGLISVGIPAAIGAVKALRTGATVLNAIRAGVTSIGMKTALLAVAVIIVGFLLYLFLDNPKKVLGIVINDTDDNLVVNDWRKGADGAKGSDLYMAFGHMQNFMVDHDGGLDSPEVQVRARINFGPNDPDNVVFAGPYFADRNFGLRGAEGVMIFTSKATGRRIAHLFACPYFEDNGAFIQMAGEGSADSFYDEMYRNRKVSFEHEQDGYRLQTNVNDARGGVIGCIAAIKQL